MKPTAVDLKNHALPPNYELIEGATVFRDDDLDDEEPLLGDQLYRKRLYLVDKQGVLEPVVEIAGLQCEHDHTAVTFFREGEGQTTIQFTRQELAELAFFLETAAQYVTPIRPKTNHIPVGNRVTSRMPVYDE